MIGNLSVMAIGPLTNVALAMNLDPEFVENVARFYIMGSSVYGVGNIAPNVEFNFKQDPHSNFIVLNGMKEQPAILFPWETSFSARISTVRIDFFFFFSFFFSNNFQTFFIIRNGVRKFWELLIRGQSNISTKLNVKV